MLGKSVYSLSISTALAIFLVCWTSLTAADQPEFSKIAGRVVDAQSGEALIGATVLVENTSIGAATDLDGYYSISKVPFGTYNVIIRSVGYAATTVEQVTVNNAEVVQLNMALSPEALRTDDVVVEARAVKNNEASLLKMRQKSSAISDAISAEELSRSGSGNAADAMTQVTGASVVGGKYVYIRGLGDRYSSAQLNGAELPSADPDKRAFQMDLLPSNMLDNIVVSKSFTPEKPGDFSGGVIDIGTKTYPESFMLKVSASSAYNSLATFNDKFLSTNTGSRDWLGEDDGTRGIPADIQGVDIPSINFAFTNPDSAYLLDKLSKSFDSNMAPITRRAPADQSYSFAVGDQKYFLGKKLGYMASLSYSRKYTFYDNGEIGKYRLSGVDATTLTNDFKLADTRGEDEVLWGGLLTSLYKLNSNNEIGFNYIHTQGGESTARYLSGHFYDGNLPQEAIYETRVLKYVERTLNSFQLNGQHHFKSVFGTTANWSTTYSKNDQNEPDVRFFSDHYTVTASDTSYTIRPSIYTVPERYYRNLDEDNFSADLKFSVPFRQWSGFAGKFSFGTYYAHKTRTYREKIYAYRNQDVNSYDGDSEWFFSDANSGIIDSSGGFYTFGNYIEDASELRANYDGDQKINAVFGMTELPLNYKLRFIGGLRYETTNLDVATQDPNYEAGRLDNKDLLPSLSLIYNLAENMNLRTAFGRTLARPTFRELAPFPSYDIANGFFFIGNPLLKRTLIDNLDLRWEWFTRPGEIIAVSTFYKWLTNPIERVIKNDNGEIQPQNVDHAAVYGAEFEFRRRLDFLSRSLSKMQVGLNFSIIKSKVDISPDEQVYIDIYDPNNDGTRPLQGQSSYLLNLDLTYDRPESRTMANLSFNVFGERLSEVGAQGTPDIYEQPLPMLNLILSQGLIRGVAMKMAVKNLFNGSVEKVHHFKDSDYIYQKYDKGRTISVGLSYNIG
jgi:TonB-dependent receptor